jgi:para-nitrobenzyl esterase
MNPDLGDVVPGLAGSVLDACDETAVALPPARGAVHSAEIEYAVGNLATNLVYAWTTEDYQVSEVVQSYWANFQARQPELPGVAGMASRQPVFCSFLDRIV